LAEVAAKQKLFEEAVLHYGMALTLAPEPEFNTQYVTWTRSLESARREQKKRNTLWYRHTCILRTKL